MNRKIAEALSDYPGVRLELGVCIGSTDYPAVIATPTDLARAVCALTVKTMEDGSEFSIYELEGEIKALTTSGLGADAPALVFY